MSDTEVANSVPTNEETKPVEQTAADYMGYGPELFQKIEEKMPESDKEQIDPQTLINETLKQIKVDENGKFIYPEGIDPVLKAAVAAAKSFRDTQSTYTKTQQELKALQAEAQALKEQLAKYETPTAGLSQEEQKELEELKYTDPDKWYSRMKALEEQAVKRVDEKFKEVREEAKAKTTAELREEALARFNQSAEQKLTPEMLQYDVPPRWVQEVESGKLTWDEFLTRAHDFIYSPKTVANPEVPQTTNMNKVGGGASDHVAATGIDYAKVVF